MGYEFFDDVNSVALKPTLLLRVFDDADFDAKRPFANPSELLKFKTISESISVHRLLSESVFNAAWKSAVDDWIDRVFKLLASDISDKSLLGVWFVGLTCRECSSNRFLASYVAWFNELLMLIQSSSSSQRVKLASCASISDLLTRLAGFQTVKDGAVYAGKVVQPIVKLLNDDDAMAVWETAAHLLSTIIQYFPFAVLRHYESVESVVVLRMLTVNSSAKEKLTCCLALLPKTRGDEDLMLKRVLTLINILLNDALEGLDGESMRQEAVSVLHPLGSSPPPALVKLPEEVARRSMQTLMPIISAFMKCFCKVISGLYPVQVTIPVHSVLAMIKRALMVDGSVHPSLELMTTTMQQEDVCKDLPLLHKYSLEALTAVVTGIDSQLLPYSADIARLLISCLKKYAFPETRSQVYSIIKRLLVSMGAGMTLYLAEEVFRNASNDLNPNDCLERDTSNLASAEPVLQPCSKKRKHSNATILSEAQQNTNNSVGDVTKDCSKLIALKISALQALEALIRAGGSLISEGLRREIDTLVFTTTANTCKRGWAYGERLNESDKATWKDFQVAALDALKASLLAPARFRHAHLAQGLKLFRDGSQLGGQEIAQTCARAVLDLEPLLHPRALPLPDYPSEKMKDFSGLGNRTYGSIDFGCSNLKPTSSDHATTLMGTGFLVTDNDCLNDIYMDKDEDIRVPLSKSHEAQNVDEQKLQTAEDQNIDNARASAKEAPGNAGSGDTMMIDSEGNGKLPNGKQEDPVPRKGETVFPPVSGSSASETEPGKAASKDHSDKTADIDVLEGDNMILKQADDNTLKLSKDDPDDDTWSLSTVELELNLGSDNEVDSLSD